MDKANNIFIINLKKDIDRWNQTVNELNKYPIRYQRYDAVYGKDLTADEIKDKVSWWGRNLLCNKALVGCFLSHTNLWKKLLTDENNDFYLILEDDFIIDDFESLSKLYNLYKNKKLDKQYLSFFLRHSDIKTSPLINVEGIPICKKLFNNTATGYFITKEGARNFLKRLGNKIHYHVDLSCWILSKIYPECEIWHTEKNLVSLHPNGLCASNIAGNIKEKTMLSMIMTDENYSNFDYPLLIFKMKYRLTVETILSLIFSILFLKIAIKTGNIIFYLLFSILILNFILSIL
jgi:GR25 family glycosyltransferase involved in LPS biosynthesis